MIPDVTAYPLSNALEILKDNNINFYLKKSVPPDYTGEKNRECIPEQFRVVRQSVVGDALVELVVSVQE